MRSGPIDVLDLLGQGVGLATMASSKLDLPDPVDGMEVAPEPS